MINLFFNNIKLFSLFVFNITICLFYLFLYDTSFFYFVLAILLINFFVILFYLRYFCFISFKGSEIYYKGIFLSYNFDFNDIVSLEKRLSDNVLILKLKNKKRIKVCFWIENGSSELFKALKIKRKDLFIPKLENFPIRYYLSFAYLCMFLARIMISLFVYYISLSNIFIFLFICFIDIKVFCFMNLGKIQFMKGKFLKVKFIFMNFLKKFLLLGNLNLTIKIIYVFLIKEIIQQKKYIF